LEDRSETMLGKVFEMDQQLDRADGQVDEVRVRRAEHHRNELVEQLRFNRSRISLIRDELLKDHDGTAKGRAFRGAGLPCVCASLNRRRLRDRSRFVLQRFAPLLT